MFFYYAMSHKLGKVVEYFLYIICVVPHHLVAFLSQSQTLKWYM